MPVTIKSAYIKYKDSLGQYVGINSVAETSTAEQVAAIEAKGEEVLESIPSEYSELVDEVSEVKSDITDIEDLISTPEISETIFASFNPSATSPASFALTPFVLNKDISGTKSITGIKLNVLRSGTLTIGTIPRTSAVSGSVYDSGDISVKNTLTFDSVGVTEKTFPKFDLDDQHYLFIGLSTDTANFGYAGGGATDLGFLYVSSGKFVVGNSFLGVDIQATEGGLATNVREVLSSAYKNKTLSILGDSISTFSGYIPSGNATYYPSGTVQNVTDTWWKKLIDALEMTLNVNNSWSGSFVSTMNGETSAGCMTRCQNLGDNPDVIIVWMGINDFNNEVALGTYDGKSAIPETTTTFREAYGIMLNKILTAYKTSEVWVCTLPQCERNGTEEFPEINGNGVALADFNVAIRELADSFGVRVLEHNKCGLTYQNMSVYNPDELHPNKYGHSLIANNDIWQMDNAVAKRYPIA